MAPPIRFVPGAPMRWVMCRLLTAATALSTIFPNPIQHYPYQMIITTLLAGRPTSPSRVRPPIIIPVLRRWKCSSNALRIANTGLAADGQPTARGSRPPAPPPGSIPSPRTALRIQKHIPYAPGPPMAPPTWKRQSVATVLSLIPPCLLRWSILNVNTIMT